LDDLLCELSLGCGFLSYDTKVREAINLIKSQQSRIDLLESAIREFLNADLRCELSSFNHEPCEAENELRYIARTNLEKLLENEK